MGRLAGRVPRAARWSSKGRGTGAAPLCKVLICIVLLCIFTLSGVGLAQVAQPDSRPPRQQKTTNPWPWFLAFILLGLACAPAIKNSKRELER